MTLKTKTLLQNFGFVNKPQTPAKGFEPNQTITGVELTIGFEPTTSSLPRKCSTYWAMSAKIVKGHNLSKFFHTTLVLVFLNLKTKMEFLPTELHQSSHKNFRHRRTRSARRLASSTTREMEISFEVCEQTNSSCHQANLRPCASVDGWNQESHTYNKLSFLYSARYCGWASQASAFPTLAYDLHFSVIPLPTLSTSNQIVLLRFWRREWDSNPRTLAGLRFSRPVHSTRLCDPSKYTRR